MQNPFLLGQNNTMLNNAKDSIAKTIAYFTKKETNLPY